MKIISLLIITLSLLSCDSNPLGETSLSGCNHSPGGSVGAPLTCQVSLPSSENLYIWHDAHDTGTLTLQNQSEVTDWLDKSGNNTNLALISLGDFAKLKKKSSNERNSIQFPTSSVTYGVDHALSGFPANQSFTVAISFKTGSLLNESFHLSNGANFNLKINASGAVSYSVGTLVNEPVGLSFQGNTLYKLILVYNSVDQSLDIFNSQSLIHTKNLGFTNGAWLDFQVSAGGTLEINELLVYTTVINTVALQGYLNSKWGF